MTTAPKTPEYFGNLKPVIIESGKPEPSLLTAYTIQKSGKKKPPGTKESDGHSGPPLA